MIYFDNAATGGFKPSAVLDAVTTTVRYLCANPGRSGHRLATAGAKTVYDCRALMGDIFACPLERVIFTKNCTEALNLAILGTALQGGHVITTAYEHNSVLRPLYYLKSQGVIELDIVFPTEQADLPRLIEQKIKPETYLVACTAVSNVTGYALPLDQIGKIAKKNDLLLLVDGAQGAGHIELNMKNLGIDMLALAGHKALSGVMGSGALLLSSQVNVRPIMHGGTGVESTSKTQPEYYPERLEAGTINLPAIAGLYEGVKYSNTNLDNFGKHLISSTTRLIDGLNKIERVIVYSKPNRSGIVSFKIDGLPSADVADLLSHEFDIAVRGGMHCAPLAHKLLGTEDEGLVRAGLAVQNSFREIDYFIKVINTICQR